MTHSLLALSLTNSLTKIGAIAALVGLVGIAILALLAFSQAREIKRLRDWAGRAPERALELEQRISAQATSRGQASPAVRATPMHVRAQAAAVAPATRVAPGATPPVQPAAPAQGTAQSPAGNETPAATESTPPTAQPPEVPQPTDQEQASPEGDLPKEDIEQAIPPAPPITPEQVIGSGAGSSEEKPGLAPSPLTGAPQQRTEPAEDDRAPDDLQPIGGPTPAPATAAARAARAPLPPTPAPSAAVESNKGPQRAHTPTPASTPPRPTAGAAGGTRPPALTGARRSIPSQRERPSGAPIRAQDYRFLKEDGRSPARTRTAVVAGLVLAAIVVIGLVVVLGKGGSSPHTSTGQSAQSTTTSKHTRKHKKSTAASNPATLAVSVLNGTETPDLAHHIAGVLNQSGYSLAKPLDGLPPGTYPKTLIEYTNGHEADADSVAHVLGKPSSNVMPLNPATQSMTDGASVVVITGVDESTSVSNGEASVGGGENGAAQ
jgi:hypothetical protein